MFLLKKENIETTEKSYEEICKKWSYIGDFTEIFFGKGAINFSMKVAAIICSSLKGFFVKLFSKIDYNIYYCNQENFNFLKAKVDIKEKNIFKGVYIIQEKHNTKKNKKILNTILKDKNKFKKII